MMEVICLEDSAFYSLIERVIARIKDQNNIKEDKWISGDEAMQKLRITSKTTLQKYRDEGRIRFTQPDKKNILYDIDSINDYLEKHSKTIL
ncbi:MAG TPA: helix-turn-helix domain-containing protein [Ferruginibacter sp.]|nr:helix-turn-helix domain-containing protein [Ferruginibacter sp.]